MNPTPFPSVCQVRSLKRATKCQVRSLTDATQVMVRNYMLRLLPMRLLFARLLQRVSVRLSLPSVLAPIYFHRLVRNQPRTISEEQQQTRPFVGMRRFLGSEARPTAAVPAVLIQHECANASFITVIGRVLLVIQVLRDHSSRHGSYGACHTSFKNSPRT